MNKLYFTRLLSRFTVFLEIEHFEFQTKHGISNSVSQTKVKDVFNFVVVNPTYNIGRFHVATCVYTIYSCTRRYANLFTPRADVKIPGDTLGLNKI